MIVPATRRDFAANSLVLIVPADSKAAAPTALNDLTAPGVKRIAYGDPASVPVGRYTEGALRAAGVWDAVSAKGVLAANVRQSLDYVARGEVDAGFVFGTDAAIMPGRVKVALTVPTKTAITYPIAVVRTAATPRRRSRSSTSSRRRRARPCCRRSASSLRASERSAMQDAWVPLLLSLKVAGWATALDIVLGVAAAFMLARWRSPLRDVVDSVLTLPLVLPPTVLGYYLLVLLGRRGVFGAWLDTLGIGRLHVARRGDRINGRRVSVDPEVGTGGVRRCGSAPRTRGAHARKLGEVAVFFRVTLPLATRGILAGALLAFARALGEFGATLMIAGNLPGRTQTLSVAIYAAVQPATTIRPTSSCW